MTTLQELYAEIQHDGDDQPDPAYTPSRLPLPIPAPLSVLTWADRAEFEAWLVMVDAQPVEQAVAA